jgi:hypothetical protein
MSQRSFLKPVLVTFNLRQFGKHWHDTTYFVAKISLTRKTMKIKISPVKKKIIIDRLLLLKSIDRYPALVLKGKDKIAVYLNFKKEEAER